MTAVDGCESCRSGVDGVTITLPTATDVGNGTIYHDTNNGPQYIPDPYLHLIAFRELNY
jgi:hypothetical protein